MFIIVCSFNTFYNIIQHDSESHVLPIICLHLTLNTKSSQIAYITAFTGFWICYFIRYKIGSKQNFRLCSSDVLSLIYLTV